MILHKIVYLSLLLVCSYGQNCQCIGGRGYGGTCTKESADAYWCFMVDGSQCPGAVQSTVTLNKYWSYTPCIRANIEDTSVPRNFSVIDSSGNRTTIGEQQNIPNNMPLPTVHDQITQENRLMITQKMENSKVDLSNNNLEDKDAKYIAELLKTNTVCVHLVLSKNKITSIGAIAIFNSLQENNTLWELALDNNNISESWGVVNDVELVHNNKLETLHLYNNEIQHSFAKHLGMYLKSFSDLMELDISNNKDITCTAGRFLYDGLTKHPKVGIYVQNTGISEYVENKLQTQYPQLLIRKIEHTNEYTSQLEHVSKYGIYVDMWNKTSWEVDICGWMAQDTKDTYMF